jgi:hypothetical protein
MHAPYFLGLCGYWKTMTSLGFALLCSKGSPIGNIYMGGHVSFKNIEPYPWKENGSIR